jgi:hypothetical protein
MTLQPLDLVCSSCGFRCCTKGAQLCQDAFNGTASFCTLEEYEARHAGEGK